MNLQKISSEFKSSVALKPSTLLILGTLFLVFSANYPPSAKVALIIAVSLALFFLGEKFSKKFNPALTFESETLRYFGGALILLSLFALYLNFNAAGGIPLFNPALRRFLSGHLTYLSFLIVPGIIFVIAGLEPKAQSAKPKAVFLMFFAAGMMALLGFRTEVLAALIAGALTAYYVEIFDAKELILLFAFAIIAFFGVSAIRGAEDFGRRAAATLATFDLAAERVPAAGLTHGYLQFADPIRLAVITPVYSGRVLISSIIGGRLESSSTATIFAPPFLDFGYAGLLMFLFFGLLLGASYKAAREKKNIYAPLHALLLTFLILGIETGIVDLIVWAYFGAGALFYIIAHNYS